ncbi:hypothetical protein [Alteribacter aurantiacus]|uniref:hypothetical protein n=1 Tax=Alteribacter aurantiacus TaxID=254410 RepID=UPI00047CD1A3|nr:hypothetical protein [Alteribacter aurantiacus]
MEFNKKLLEMLVESTFQKHDVKKAQSKLTKKQKERLRSIVKEMEQEVKVFVDKTEKKDGSPTINQKPAAPPTTSALTSRQKSENKPYLSNKINRKNR